MEICIQQQNSVLPEYLISRKAVVLDQLKVVSPCEVQTDCSDAWNGYEPLVIGLANVLKEGYHIDINIGGKDGGSSLIGALEERSKGSIIEDETGLIELRENSWI